MPGGLVEFALDAALQKPPTVVLINAVVFETAYPMFLGKLVPLRTSVELQTEVLGSNQFPFIGYQKASAASIYLNCAFEIGSVKVVGDM